MTAGVSAAGGFAAADSRYAQVITDLQLAADCLSSAARGARELADEPVLPEIRKALHHTLHRLRPVASIVTEQYVRLGAL